MSEVILRKNFTDNNGDEWFLYKIRGMWSNFWAISRADDDDWDFPSFVNERAAIDEIHILARGE